jgi:hypothetical protein
MPKQVSVAELNQIRRMLEDSSNTDTKIMAKLIQ